MAVKSGASCKAPDRAIGGVGSTRAHAPQPSGLCLNPTIRPPGSLQVKRINRPASTRREPINSGRVLVKMFVGNTPPNLMASGTCDPSTRGGPRSLIPTSVPREPSTCVFSPLRRLGTTISQTSYHMFTEHHTVLEFLNRFTFVGNTITRSKNKKPQKGRNRTLPPILLSQPPVSDVLKKQVLSRFFPSCFPISRPSFLMFPSRDYFKNAHTFFRSVFSSHPRFCLNGNILYILSCTVFI